MCKIYPRHFSPLAIDILDTLTSPDLMLSAKYLRYQIRQLESWAPLKFASDLTILIDNGFVRAAAKPNQKPFGYHITDEGLQFRTAIRRFRSA